MISKLKHSQLKPKCYANDIDFKESSYRENIIGQSSGEEALRFGLQIKEKGYNIYIAGLPASGKTTFAKRFAEDIARYENTPDDLCYVLDFKDVNTPKLLKLKAGHGKMFKEDMDELINKLSVELPEAFGSIDHEDFKERLYRNAQKDKDEVIKDLSAEAKEYDFAVRTSQGGGIYFSPIINGKTVSEEEFDELSEDEKDRIADSSEEVQELASYAMKRFKAIDKEVQAEIEKMEYNIGLLSIGHLLTPVQEKYVNNEDVSRYLIEVKEDMLNNIDNFLPTDNDYDDPLASVMPWTSKAKDEDCLKRYDINLLVDNSELEGAPVVVDFNPTYANIIGEIEYENENGNLVTDFMKIKPGLIHKANGGYLIFHAQDLLNSAFAWDAIKRVLKSGNVAIEPLKEYQIGAMTIAGMQPQSLDVDVKVIIVGSTYLHQVLKEYDDDFDKLFKINVLFDYEMDNNTENAKVMTEFIQDYITKNSIADLDEFALCKIFEYSSKMAERQDKLTTRLGIIVDIITEANTWVKIDKQTIISGEYIDKAINKRLERSNLYALKYNEMIVENEIMIDTEGSKVGQINGLSVMEMSDYSFGMPTRITANTYIGKAGIVNIEKEANMSGSIHDKGVQVLTGYLGSKYAQEFPLTLSCRLCFEQSYSGVDGDSASSTETYAIISSLSNIGINQSLAVTGSMNQKGEIQPIGGVIHKIEGFFDICNKRGLTGEQGCIIPRSNVNNLVLKDEVVEAVKNNMFHIYAIDNIDDGIELLMNKKAGKPLAKGNFSKDSVHNLVYNKLKEYYKKSVE